MSGARATATSTRARFQPVGDVVLIGEPVTVSPLTSTLTRETRDDVLDATRGQFLSQAFSFSPGWLGSDLPYLKYFGQYFHYFALQAPKRKPFTNEMLRPRLVFATGVRLGLAKGIGGEVPISERFFAGGSIELRGFAQNAVGPIGPDLSPPAAMPCSSSTTSCARRCSGWSTGSSSPTSATSSR